MQRTVVHEQHAVSANERILIHERRLRRCCTIALSNRLRTMYAGVAENFAKPLMTCSKTVTQSADAERVTLRGLPLTSAS